MKRILFAPVRLVLNLALRGAAKIYRYIFPDWV
jgi:hypothetical protein